MHCGNDQVSRLRGIESELHCFSFAQFAYDDNIGIFAQHIDEPCLKEGVWDRFHAAQ